jgi:Uma2 family endonuclease
MDNQGLKNKVEEPSAEYLPTGQEGLPTRQASGRYTYADYLTWQMEEMVELIKGKVFKRVALPGVNHQGVSENIFNKLSTHLEKMQGKVFTAPFDVRLPLKSKKNEDINTIIQPDICVICNPEKLDELGCVGAPDLIVEILDLGNNRKDVHDKYFVYEEAGVKEYWIVLPYSWCLQINRLVNGKYKPSKLFTIGDIVKSDAVEGFQLDLTEVFENIH